MLGNAQVKFKSGSDYKIAPMDKYTVQIADVNAKMVFSKYSGVEEQTLNFEFVILDDRPLPEDENGVSKGSTRGIKFRQLINPTWGKKSSLLELAKAVLGRDPTDDEKDENSSKCINVDNWIGKQVVAMVIEKPNSDNTAVFNKSTAFSKVAKPLPSLVSETFGQTVKETETKPVTVNAKVPNLNPELDKFLGDLDSDEEPSSKDPEAKHEEAEEEEKESLEELEAKINLAKARAKAAK